MKKKPLILCVDDEKIVLDSLLEQLEVNFGKYFNFEMAESAEEGLEIIQDCIEIKQDVAIIISDQLMPGVKGDAFIIEAHKLFPNALKILLTGEANFEAVSNVINHAQLYRYISKPWEKTDFLLTIEEASRSYLQRAELKDYNELLKNLNLASQELSKSVNLEGLIKKLLSLTVQHSHAERGVLVAYRDNRFWYRADFSPKQKETNLYHFEEQYILNDESLVPLSIIESVYKNQKSISFENLSLVAEHKNAPYVTQHKPKSVLCLPLKKQGFVLAILYLEHTSAKNLFGDKIVESLDVLLSQVAISLDNIQLYNSLEKRVKERTQEVVAQKEIIELQNRDMLASIRYARRIQENILPLPEQVNHTFADHFVFSESKDILSGDFYWFSQRYHHAFLVVADCTGHGVPGAFMSIIGHTLLNQIVNEEDIYDPSLILSNLHHKLGKFLSYSDTYSENALRDGMDVAIIRYDILDKTIHFAGAKRPLYVHPKGKDIQEIKGDAYPIGGEITIEQPSYKTHTLQTQSGDKIYLSTDGYIDQFNAEDNKRFSNKRFKEVLQNSSFNTMPELGIFLGEEWLRWRGKTEQTDDILLVGLQIP